MAPRTRPTASKRQKERNREEHRLKKVERKASRDAEKTKRKDAIAAGVDPDIAEIQLGPVPIEGTEAGGAADAAE